MKILGIDPGLATIGLGLIESNGPQDAHAIEWLTIETPAGLELGQRLVEIQADITEYITTSKPELIVMEKLYFSTNAKTAIDVAQARGVLLTACLTSSIQTIEATPLQLKQAITGDGKADKRQVQDMVQRLLNLEEIPKPDDAADGLALAIYGSLYSKHQL